MPFNKWTFLIAVLGVLGAIVFFWQFPRYAPQASFDMKLTRPEVIDQARSFLKEMGYNADSLDADAVMMFDPGIPIYLEYELGLVEAHNVLRADTLSILNWNTYFYDRSLPRNQMPDRYDVWITPTGNILGFRHRWLTRWPLNLLRRKRLASWLKIFSADEAWICFVFHCKIQIQLNTQTALTIISDGPVPTLYLVWYRKFGRGCMETRLAHLDMTCRNRKRPNKQAALCRRWCNSSSPRRPMRRSFS